MRFVLCVCVLAALSCLPAMAVAAGDQAAEMASLRKRAQKLLSGSAGATGGPRYLKAVAAVDEQARAILASSGDSLEFVGPDDKSKSNRLARYFKNVQLLSQAHSLAGGKYFGDPAVLARIQGELRRGLPFVAPGQPQPGNWHGYVIKIPASLASTLLLVGDKLDPAIRESLETCTEGLLVKMTLTGTNAATESYNHILYAIYSGDADRLSRAVAHMLPTITCGTTGGILEDYAFQFHGRILYAGVYGIHYLISVAEVVSLIDGTPWQVPAERSQLLIRFALEHMQWVLAGRHWDLSVTGRDRLSGGHATDSLLSVMLYFSRMDTPKRGELEAAAARLAGQYGTLPVTTAGMADEIAGVQVKPLDGFRFYHTSEFALQRGEGFYASVRMFSRRMQDYEVLTKRGANGWNLCYGLTYISHGAGELWTGDGAVPVSYIDMDHLPGTTSRIGANPIDIPETIEDSCNSLNFGTGEFAGAAGDEAGGMAGFILVPVRGDFTARKGYFFFDEGFAAVGSGITSGGESDKPIHTTVTQWAAATIDAPLHLSDGRQLTAIDGEQAFENIRWAWLNGVGYVFGQSVTLHAKRVGRLTTLWLDHGANPHDAKYAYIVLANASLERTRAEAIDSRISILANTPEVQSIRDHRDGAEGTIYYQACPGKADKPAIMHRRPTAGGEVITLQNPRHTHEPVTLTLPADVAVTAKPAEVIVEPGAERTRVTFDTVLGRPCRIGVGSVGDVRQPVREDLLEYHSFLIQAEHTPEATYLTVRVPADARQRGYRLIVRGFKSHRLVELTAESIVGQSPDGTVRFKWTREINPAKMPTHLVNQREGSFRLALISGPRVGIDYFTVPRFDDDGKQLPIEGFDRDKTRPPYE